MRESIASYLMAYYRTEIAPIICFIIGHKWRRVRVANYRNSDTPIWRCHCVRCFSVTDTALDPAKYSRIRKNK